MKIYSVVPTRAELTVLLNACQLRRRFQEVVHRVLCIVALNYSFLIQNATIACIFNLINHLVFLLRCFDVFRLFGESVLTLATCFVRVVIFAPWRPVPTVPIASLLKKSSVKFRFVFYLQDVEELL